MMPAMNGLQLLASLRAREMKQPCFVFLSAKAQPSEIDEAMAAGADGYLVKPFEPQALLAEVHRLVGGE
jgi:CheY-like chemotaxis protein